MKNASKNARSPSERKNPVAQPVVAEEVEVTAHLTVPTDGGWAWVVLASTFVIVMIVDGSIFTFGTMIHEIANTFNVSLSIAAAVNSLEIGFYYLLSPIAASLLNKFGFRTVAMLGAIISSIGLMGTYFTENYSSLIFFLGFSVGFGDSLLNMSLTIIIGFYFEKRRALAAAIATGGSSVGVMLFYPCHAELVKLAGWRPVILLQAGLHGLVYFLSLTYRPLVTLQVTQVERASGVLTRTLTYLPSLTIAQYSSQENFIKPSITERMLGTASIARFPTVARILEDNATTTDTQKPGPSGISKITLEAQNIVHKSHLKQIKSKISQIMEYKESQTTNKDLKNTHIEVIVKDEEVDNKKSGLWKLFDWEEHVSESRPMYRDDVFYDRSVKELSIYQKSVAGLKKEEITGFEYQMAVSRVICESPEEERAFCATAMRRALISMIDPSLLKRKSFLLFALSGLCAYSGILVPYVFLTDRNLQQGVDPHHCKMFVSVISFSNLLGRLIINALAIKLDPLVLYIVGLTISGVCTIFSDLSYNVEFQYTFCFLFGFFISVSSCLRSVVLVSLYGLESLTNATGLILVFIGIGNIYSTPMAGAIKSSFGYKASFCISGAFITLGGIIAMPIKICLRRENKTMNPAP